MKETILDILMFMFQSYVDDEDGAELDKNLLHENLINAGFSGKNIEKAFEWLEAIPGENESFLLKKPKKNSFRLYSDAEYEKIGDEGLCFLMFLERLDIFHGEIREHVIDRIMALDTYSVDLGQIRWVVLMILFNIPGNESSYAWLQNLNSENISTYVH